MIPHDKIWMVTGDPRSRTSLAMMMLESLGVPVAGDKFSPRAQEDPRAQRLNPHGFYEVVSLVSRGITTEADRDLVVGKAVKIISGAAVPNPDSGGMSAGVPADLVNRYIVCLRNPRNVIQSQAGLLSSTDVASGNTWEIGPRQSSPATFLSGTGELAFFLAEHPEIRDRVVVVNYEDWNESVPRTLDAMASSLGLQPTPEQREVAIGRFDGSTTRVVPKEVWDDKFVGLGRFADAVYEMLKARDWAGLRAIAPAVRAELLDAKLESSVWVDIDHRLDPRYEQIESQVEDLVRQGIDPDVARDRLQRFWGTWVMATPDYHKIMHLNCSGARDRNRQMASLQQNPSQCQHYHLNGCTEEVPVPSWMPNTEASDRMGGIRVIRLPLVQCGRDGRTISQVQCRTCFYHGSMVGGMTRGPQRLGGAPTELMKFAKAEKGKP